MHHKTTGRLYATTTRTGGYPQTNDESNVSPMSSKKRQRSQNESAFAAALTDTNRYSTQRWMPLKSAKTPGPSKSVQAWRQHARAADTFVVQGPGATMSGDYSHALGIYPRQLSED